MFMLAMIPHDQGLQQACCEVDEESLMMRRYIGMLFMGTAVISRGAHCLKVHTPKVKRVLVFRHLHLPLDQPICSATVLGEC